MDISKDNIISVQKNRGRGSNTLQVKTNDGKEASVPTSKTNRHYIEVLKWVDAGNSILDPPPKNIPDDHPGTAFNRHPLFTLPDDETTIWRYMGFEQFISLLISESLWFSRGNILRKLDPYEGQLPNPNLSIEPEILIKSMYGDITKDPKEIERFVKSHRNIQDIIRVTTLINCWNKFDYESYAMWKVYGKGSNCIAIKSDIGSLKQAFGSYSDYNVYIGEIKYIDYSKETISEHNYFNLFLHKAPFYKAENEIRCVISDDGYTKLFANDEPYVWDIRDIESVDLSPGTEVKIDFKMLVKEIIIGPDANEWFKPLVINLLNDYKFNISVQNSALKYDA